MGFVPGFFVRGFNWELATILMLFVISIMALGAIVVLVGFIIVLLGII